MNIIYIVWRVEIYGLNFESNNFINIKYEINDEELKLLLWIKQNLTNYDSLTDKLMIEKMYESYNDYEIIDITTIVPINIIDIIFENKYNTYYGNNILKNYLYNVKKLIDLIYKCLKNKLPNDIINVILILLIN